MAHVSLLERPVMTAHEAARQLRMPAVSLLRWLEGHTGTATHYDAVLREQPTGSLDMTWGEFVEARYLRAYRTQKGVPLQRLRPFIAQLRQEFGVPYPLAHFRPFVDPNRGLLVRLAEQVNLPPELWPLQELRNGQLVITSAVGEYLSRVEFADDPAAVSEQSDENRVVVRIRPRGKRSPLVMDPLVASGAATIRGTRTEALAERAAAGEGADEIAAEFDLTVAEVQAALSWEWDKSAV